MALRRFLLLDRRLAGAAPVGERDADDHPARAVRIHMPEHVRPGDHRRAISHAGPKMEGQRPTRKRVAAPAMNASWRSHRGLPVQ